MEKSSPSSSTSSDHDTPPLEAKTSMPPSPPVENLLLSVANLSLSEGKADTRNNVGLPPISDLFAVNGGSLSRINGAPPGFENSMQFASPLYSGDIWAPKSLMNYEYHLQDSSLRPTATSFVPNYSSLSCGTKGTTANSVMSNSMAINKERLKKVIGYLSSLKGDNFVLCAINPEGSKRLHDWLQLGKEEITCEMFRKVFTVSSKGIPMLFHLMVDQHGWHVFAELIDSLNEGQLTVMIYEITRDLDRFIELTLDKQGSNSMKKLIKVIKRFPPLIACVVNKLCLEFYKIMTHPRGSYVVTDCLNTFSSDATEPLYEEAIKCGLAIAIHPDGCKAINRLINTIQGAQRSLFLDLIATNVAFLAQEPEGNYVVQKVISLNNPIITQKICILLVGHYTSISLQRGGSHIVENCLDSPWMSWVVEDLLSNTNQLLHVARDQFGNYVIQKALRVTKKSGSPLYHRLVSRLRPHLSSLQSGFGRNIFNLITGRSSVRKV